MPQISVIVPVYKVEPYLRRCVDSILAQTYTDFELILVDDGSPDECPQICDEYKEKDERVVVIHQKNGGLSAARNAGIDWAFANSDSEWLAFVDSDDWVHTKYLEALFQAVNDTGLNISVCLFERTNGTDPTVDENALVAECVNAEQFYCEKNVEAIVAWNKLYKKECFRRIRYPVGKLHEDEFTTYKILFQYDSIAVISESLYFYFYNENSIMGQKWGPQRLVALDAYMERIAWFLKRNHLEMYKWSLEQYIFYVFTVQKKVSRLDNSDDVTKNRRRLRSYLRKLLCGYYRDLPICKNYTAYEMAFPTLMKIYWYYKAVANRIVKRKSEG